MKNIIQALTNQCVAPVSIRLLHHAMVVEITHVAQVGDVIFRHVIANQFSCVLVILPGQTNQIQRDVAQGNVLFQDGSVTAPFRQAMT